MSRRADPPQDSVSDNFEAGEHPARITILQRVFSFSATVGASLGTFGFFAIQGILLARMLGPENRGQFAAAVMFPQVFLYLGLLGAPELFAGYAASGAPNGKLRRSAARYGLFAGCVSTIACLLLDWLTIPTELRHILPLAIACALTMPLQQIRLAVQAVDHGQREFTRYNAVRLVAAAAFPATLLVAWLLGFHSLQLAVWLFVAAQGLSLLLVQFGMDESWLGPRSVSIPKGLYEARGLMSAWFTTEMLERLDLVLIMILVADDKTLGYYAAAVPIASLMIIVPNAAGLYAFNRGARSEELLSTADAWRFIWLGLAIQCLSAIALAIAIPILIPFFYTDAFSPTIQYAWLLLPAGAFRGLLQAGDSYLRARKKSRPGVVARAFGIPILLVVSFIGVPWIGTPAVPIGLLLAQALCFVLVARAVVMDTRKPAI